VLKQIKLVPKSQKLKLSSQQILLALCSGILLAVAFVVTSLDWIAWIALAPLFFAFYNYPVNGKTGCQLSFIFSLTFYLGLLTWIFRLHPLTWIGFSEHESMLIITAGWLAFSLFESLGLSLIGLVIGLTRPTEWRRVLLPVSLWVIIEWIQSLSNFGFTWGRLAISQFQNLTMIQSANLFGTLFLSSLIVLVNATLAITLIDYLKYRNQAAFRVIPAVLAILIMNFAYGFYSINTREDSGKEIKAAIIQGDILSDQKWNMKLQDSLDIYLGLSYKAVGLDRKIEKPDFIIWPETAVIDILSHQETLYQLQNFTSFSKTYLLTGIFTSDLPYEKMRHGEKYQLSNSMVGIDPNGQIMGIYSKRHLVPFGEYLPFKSFLTLLMPKIAQMNALKSDVAPGTDTGIIKTPFGKIGGLICFESIFPEVIKKSVNDGAELLVLVTNDSWFKDSMAVYQHRAQSVFRAVENDRYMIRAANTGVSSIISPSGEILVQLGALQKGFIDGKVKFRDTVTLYSQIGDIIVFLALGILVFILSSEKVRSEG
jgi:apolipoprotein N-acyltransferase